jgi:hypothetical protein
MSTTDKRAVKFVQAWRGYSAGEIAGFDEKVAEQLVKGKVAEEYSAEGEKGSPTQTPAKAPAPRAPASSKRGNGKADAPAPAPAPADGGGPDGSADPAAGSADTTKTDGAEGGSADPAAATGGSADNDDRP